MKRCPNLSCGTTYLYSNDKITCPFCRSTLVANQGSMEAPRPILPPDRVDFEETEDFRMEEEFVQRRGRRMECYGRVIEIDHQELFHSRGQKLVNSLFRGEPYQFGHQVIEYTIRVENITDGFPTEITDFCLYGSYLGRLQVGDEVRIRARAGSNRRVVKSIYNETTASAIRPGLQLSAGVVRLLLLLLAVSIIMLVGEIVWLFASGAVMNGLLALIDGLMPAIIVCVGLWLLVKSIFPRRRL